MDPAAETERIVDDGDDIRERVRRLTRDTLAKGMGSAEQGVRDLGDLAERMFNAAAAAANRKPESGEARSAMQDVVDGFTAGFGEAADATRETIGRAGQQGQRFAREDLKQSIDDLHAVRESLVRAVSNVAGSIKGMVNEEAAAMKDRARQASDAAKPKIDQAARAAREHPGELANDAAASALHAGAAAIGLLGQAVSGALSGLGDALAERSQTDPQARTPPPPADEPDRDGEPSPGPTPPGA
jgi:hypothetical protein